jgi:hypothetical protein
VSWIGLQVCHFSVQVADNSILGLQLASRGSSGRRLHLQGSSRVVVKELHPPESLQQAEGGSGPFGNESCLSRTAHVPVSTISCCVTKQLRPPVSNIQCQRVETSSQSRLTDPTEAITGCRSPLAAPLYQYLGRLIVLLVAVPNGRQGSLERQAAGTHSQASTHCSFRRGARAQAPFPSCKCPNGPRTGTSTVRDLLDLSQASRESDAPPPQSLN